MRRAGTVVGVAQGVAVVRSTDDQFPDVGTELVDEKLESLGDVVDVFGPVEQPYLAVSPPDDRRVATLVGDVVYARH
jgi:RNA-binding protein